MSRRTARIFIYLYILTPLATGLSIAFFMMAKDQDYLNMLFAILAFAHVPAAARVIQLVCDRIGWECEYTNLMTD